MSIELPKETHDEAVASLQRYFQAHLDEELGNLAADGLLRFFLEEIGPAVYNAALRDVQERARARILELDVELHQPEFPYWWGKDRARGR